MLDTLVFYIPLGVVGLFRWACWAFRRVPAMMYRPYVSDHWEPLTVVTPVYREDPEIFAKAIESWLANRLVVEVICVIDETDAECRAVAARYPVTSVTTDVPGKRDALRRGWEMAGTELVALVDSDTIWAPDVSERVCEPFADPRIGGVGTRQNVYEPLSFWQRVNDIYLDYRYFEENPAQTRFGRAVSCLSGRTAIYRQSLLLEVSDDFMNERFMGIPCNSGEDKRLTTLILSRGYLTYMQRSARVWSTFPRGGAMFFKQRLRWARNTWRSDLRALGRRRTYRHRFLVFSMLDKAISPFALLLSPIYMSLAILRGDWPAVVILTAWWLVSRSFRMIPHLRRQPRDIAIVPQFILLTFVMATVRIYALATITRQRWLTRPVEVVDGAIVRTQPAA